MSTASISQGGRHLLQAQNSNQGTQQQTPASPTSTAPAPEAPVQMGTTPAAAGLKSGYFGTGPFNNKVYSQSKPVAANSIGLKSGVQYVVTTPVAVSGTARCASSPYQPHHLWRAWIGHLIRKTHKCYPYEFLQELQPHAQKNACMWWSQRG